MNFIKCFVTVCVAFVVSFVPALKTTDTAIDTYTLEGIVSAIDNNEVIVLDNKGREWAFFGDGYAVNDTIVMELNTKGTASIYDDEIVNIF